MPWQDHNGALGPQSSVLGCRAAVAGSSSEDRGPRTEVWIECAAMKRILIAALAFLAALPLLAQKRAFTLEDVYRVKAVGDLTATEDGSRIAFTVTSRDLPHAKSSKKIWIANADGSDMRAVTNGAGAGSPPLPPRG